MIGASGGALASHSASTRGIFGSACVWSARSAPYGLLFVRVQSSVHGSAIALSTTARRCVVVKHARVTCSMSSHRDDVTIATHAAAVRVGPAR